MNRDTANIGQFLPVRQQRLTGSFKTDSVEKVSE
jgi:hypothetical protein